MRKILLASTIICGLTSHASAEPCLTATEVETILNTAVQEKVTEKAGDKASGFEFPGQKTYKNITKNEKWGKEEKTCRYGEHQQEVLTYKISK